VNHEKTQKYLKLFQVTLAAVAVYLILKYLLPLVLPFVLSFFLCRIFYPWAEKLEKKTKIPLTLWACVFIGTLAAVFIVLFLIVSRYLYGQLQCFSWSLWLENLWEQLFLWLASILHTDTDTVRLWFDRTGADFLKNMQTNLPEKLASFCVNSIKGMGKTIIVIFIALVGTVLLMKNKKRIRGQISRNIFAREITGLAGRICEVSAGFFKCQAVIIAVIAVVLAIGLSIMGNRYGVLIGISLAFLDALPVIGSGTVLLPWALILVLSGNYKNAVILVILYGISTVIREVLEPRLMGDKLGINEFYMLMATFIGIALFGVWGIFLGPLGMIMILEILKQMEDLYREDKV